MRMRFTFQPWLGPLAFFALLAVGPAEPDLAAIAAANGHPALAHLRLDARVVRNGVTTEERLDLEGITWLRRSCTGDACSGTWFDGRRAYGFGVNGAPLPLDDGEDPERRTVAAIATLAFTEPAFARDGGVAVPLPPQGDALRWRVAAPGGIPLVASFDRPTLAVRTVERDDGVLVARYGGERRAGSIAVALTRRDDAAIVASDVVRESAPLEPPRAPAPVLSAGIDAPLSALPIPIAPCRLGGVAARCLIDSGTTPSAMTLTFAERLGLEPTGSIEVRGFARTLSGVVTGGPLEIAGAHYDRLRFAIAPLSRDLGFDAIIGSDLLAGAVVRIDTARRTLRFEPPQTPPNGTAIPLVFREGAPYVPLRVRGRARSALFDTGDVAGVSIGYDDFRRELSDLPVRDRVEVRGIGGGSDAFVVDAPDVAVGALALGTYPVRVVRSQHGAHVGIGLAAHCTLVLDYARSRALCAGTSGART